jgi:hypothetical protein
LNAFSKTEGRRLAHLAGTRDHLQEAARLIEPGRKHLGLPAFEGLPTITHLIE